jgi:pimeloyl-ACP methyl ester carboxylesterase
MCAGWDTGPVSLIEDQPVVSDIPVLIMSGENDPITTNIWAQMAAETLSNSQYFEFSGFGHAVFSPELDNLLCQKTIVDAFVKNPEAPVDGSCVAEYEPFFFIME